MGLYKFSIALGEKDAGVQAIDLNVSYKDMVEVMAAIKKKPVNEAMHILEDAIAMKAAIPYRRYSKGLGHRPELGGHKGRYPKKECKAALKLLKAAMAAARQKGLGESLFVKHAAAYKQQTFPRYRRYWVGGMILGYGKRALWSRYTTARAEIVVSEKGD